MDENLFERIQLSFSLDNCLKGPTYQVEFFLKDYDKFETETEKINIQADSTHIDFTKTFNCDYHFSKIQFFTVNVIRRKDRQKMTNFKAIDENHRITLSSIVANKDSIYTCPIRESAPNSEKLPYFKIYFSFYFIKFGNSSLKNFFKYHYINFFKKSLSYNSLNFKEKFPQGVIRWKIC